MKKKIFILVLTLFTFILLNADQKNIYIGVYLSDVSGFDISQGRFNADLYLWCKWLGNDSIPKFNIANGEITRIEELEKESDGDWHTVKYHIQGMFRGTFPLQKFPFDKQKLTIQIEIPCETGNIKPDLAGSGMAEAFSISGWNYNPYFKTEIIKKRHYSDFGSIKNEGKPYETNSLIFILDIERPIIPYILKYLLPLLIVLITSILGFFISPEELEANLGLVITALLTCVALHFSLANSIPEVSYLVTVDKMFIGAYILLLFNVIETVVSFKISKNNLDFAIKLERYSWKGSIIAMVLGLSFLIFLDYLPQKEIKTGLKNKIIYNKSSKDTLILSVLSIKTLNSSNIQHGLIYRGLYYYSENGEKIPHLIKKVPSLTNEYVRFLSDGSVIVRWELKPNLKWGDGSVINSDDLIFSLNATEDKNIKNITKINKYIIEVQYEKKKSEIIDKFVVYPKKHFEKVYKEKGMNGIYEIMFNKPPFMDGPYILKEFIPEKEATFIINPYFAGKKPNINKIIIRASDKKLPDIMKAKEADIGLNLGVETFEKLKNIDYISLKEDADNSLYLLQLDTSVYPYNDKNFRKAINYAIDKDKIRKLLFGDKGYVANSYRPTNTSDYNGNITMYEYNPEKSRVILSGLKIYKPIKLFYTKQLLKSPELKVAESIINDLNRIGLRVETGLIESTVKAYSSGNHGGILYTSKASNFDDVTYFWTKSLLNDDIKKYDEKFTNTMFNERKIAISKQLQAIWSEEIPIVPMAFGVYRTVTDSNLMEWSPLAVNNNLWWNVEYWYFK